MEPLTKEVGKLQMDLERQESLASRRGEVIAELKGEACSQWASGWLAVTPIFKHISFKPFQLCGSIFVHYSRPINI